MKRSTFAISIALIIGAVSCNDDSRKAEQTPCIECNGCFGGWTECSKDWNNDSITWEEHVQYMTTQTEATFNCKASH